MTCTCWPRGGPMCSEHGDITRDPHHWHGVNFGEEGECCVCQQNPCGGVDVEDMTIHRWWDLDQWSQRSEGVDAPF